MAPKSLRFVLIANWIFTCFLSFTTVMYWDEDTPLAVRAGIIVREWDQSKPAGELRSEIEQFAIERKITVGRLRDDLEGTRRGRTLYLVDGDPSVAADEWLHGGYKDFTQSLTTQVLPFSEAGDREPTGIYVVFGDYSKAVELVDYFSSQGLTVSRQFDRWSLNPKDLFLQDEQVNVLGMMMLVAVAVAAAGVLVGARTYGVKRLQGLGYGNLLLDDIRSVVVYWLSAGVLSVGMAMGILAAYNGLANIGFYLLTAFIINCVLVGTAIAAHALVLLLLMRLRVLAAVKGELPGRTASAVAYTLRVVAVIATVLLAQRAIAVGIDVDQRTDALSSYAQLGDTSTIKLGNAWSSGDQESIRTVVGAWIRDEDRAGHVVLAGRKYLQDKGALNGQNLIYVNENFLRDQPIQLADGTEFTTKGVTRPTLLIPSGLWGQHNDVAESARKSPDLRRENDITPEFNQVKTAAGQEVFTYASDSVGPMSQGNVDKDQSFATDPIVVFLPSEQGLLKDHSYYAFASQGRVLFPEPQLVSNAVAADPKLRGFIVSVTPVIDQAATGKRDVLQKFRLALFGALAGMLVLLVTGIGAVLIYTRRNGQWIFARHVSGWRFTATHRVLLIFETGVLAVLVGWLPYQAWTIEGKIAAYESRGIPAPFEPMILGIPEWVATGVLAVLTVVGVLTALTGAHRRVVRNGASEA